MDNTRGIGLKDGMSFPIAGERLRRDKRSILCPGRLNGEHHRNPINWLPLRITNPHNHFRS
jgi:hypothetical protein